MTVAEIAPKRGKQSTAPDSLWEAFTAAQEQFGPLIKNKVGAHKASYAPLDSVLEMVRPILNEHGLALTQPTAIEDGTLVVRTIVVHKATKEMHECAYPAGALSLQHQQLGAGVTYARRYSLLSLLGIFPENEDDDGSSAGTAGGSRTPSHPPTRQQPPSIRPAAQPFIDKAKEELAEAQGDYDAVHVAFDAIKAKPGWKQLNAAEQSEITKSKMEALPDAAR